MKIGFFSTLLFCLIIFSSTFNVQGQTPFTIGNLVVLNVNSGTAASLLEYTITGSLVQTIAVPSTGVNAITLSPSAGSEGALSRSDNAAYLGFAGYRTGTNASGTDRVIARVDANGVVNTSSVIPGSEGFTSNNIRGAVFSNDGLRYWASGTGTGGGVRTNVFSATSGSIQVSTTIANARTVNIINGQLYCTAASGSIQSAASVGVGLPIAAGNTISILPGLPTSSGPSSYAFSISPGAIANGSVMYISDDRASALGGIQKWVYNAGAWSLIYTLGTGVANIGTRGVTVNYTGLNTATGFGSILYATTAEATTNRIIKIIDNGSGSLATTLVTAPASTIFKGIVFSPVSNLPPVVTSNSSTAIVGTFYSYTVTATNNPTSYSASGLPPGLTFNSGSGVLSGTPTTSGNFVITLNAANTNGVGSGTLNLKVCGITSTSTQTNVLCNGTNTGSATLTPSGGLMPYSYTWLPSGGSANIASSLSAGTYTVNITDANACTATQLITITQPALPFVSFGTHNNATCAGYCDGAISMLATGGVQPYTYAWSAPGYFSPIVTNMCPGSYTVTATDQNGCTTNYSATITQPVALNVTKSQTPILCNGGISTLTLIGTGGTAPYQYGVPPNALQYGSVYNLSAGTYSFYVIDANTCFYQDTVIINEPAAIVPSITYTPVQCAGGSTILTISALGGFAPYQYQLNAGSFQNLPQFTVTGGSYIITVKDAHQCTVSLSVSIDDPLPIQISAAATQITCNASTSSITVSASGGTGLLEYQLNNGGYNSSSLYTVSTPGIYLVTVRDSNLCTAQTSVNVVSVAGLLANETHIDPQCFGGSGTVTITASGGTPPYVGTGVFAQVAGAISYSITDSNGCMANVLVVMNQPNAPLVSATFTPMSSCYGNSVTPSATGLSTYTWSGGLVNSVPFVATNSSTYTISGTDVNGCTGSTTIFLNVSPPSTQLALALSGNSSTLNTSATAIGSNLQFDGSNLAYTDNSCQLISNVTDIAGGNQLGFVNSMVHVEASIQTYNAQPYVRRWYELSASSTAAAMITLYLTQDDFDDYNAANTMYPNLPLSGSNIDPNIANISITKITGGALGLGNATVITPSMYWNAATNYWEATFSDSVLGLYYFHGANPANIPLPVTLVNFYGTKSGQSHILSWVVTNQINCNRYELQTSTDAIHFITIATRSCFDTPNGMNDTLMYSAANENVVHGHNYYRLNQIDIDGHINIASKQLDLVEENSSQISLYPNPVTTELFIEYLSDWNADVRFKLINAVGDVMKKGNINVQKGFNKIAIDVSKLPSGLYMILFYKNNQLIHSEKITK